MGRRPRPDGWRVPPPLPLGRIDRDLVQEFKCFMCGRAAPLPRPPRCPICGGNWFVSDEYLPRYE